MRQYNSHISLPNDYRYRWQNHVYGLSEYDVRHNSHCCTYTVTHYIFHSDMSMDNEEPVLVLLNERHHVDVVGVVYELSIIVMLFFKR